LLVIAAVLGLVFSLVGSWGLWRFRQGVEERVGAELQLLDDTLTATALGLEVAEDSLRIALANTRAIEAVLVTASNTISSTTPLLGSLADVMGENLPGTISATTTSLDSAQASARIIEDILGAITSIPFMPLDPYEPEVPLYLALGRVSADLSEMPATLMEMESNIRDSGRNLDVVEADLRVLVLEIGQIETGLVEAREVVRDYQVIVERLSLRIAALEDRLPVWINWATWLGTAILLWVAITQAGLLLHGLELTRA
jgi:hypothetical protein